MEEFRVILEGLGLTLSPEKTRITHVDDGYEFLGFHIQRKPRRCAPQQKALYVTATQRNIQRYKERIKELLGPTQGDVVNKIRAVNRVVRGWANYYRHVQSSGVRDKLDYWTFRAVWKWLYRKHSGKAGWKALYKRYITRNAKGRKVLGYRAVHLTSTTANTVGPRQGSGADEGDEALDEPGMSYFLTAEQFPIVSKGTVVLRPLMDLPVLHKSPIG